MKEVHTNAWTKPLLAQCTQELSPQRLVHRLGQLIGWPEGYGGGLLNMQIIACMMLMGNGLLKLCLLALG